MGSLHFFLKRIGAMNRSCRREPAGEARFAKRIHAFTGVATSRFMESLPFASILPHEFLRAFADDVAGVNVALRVERETMDPIQLARLFLAVLAFRRGP